MPHHKLQTNFSIINTFDPVSEHHLVQFTEDDDPSITCADQSIYLFEALLFKPGPSCLGRFILYTVLPSYEFLSVIFVWCTGLHYNIFFKNRIILRAYSITQIRKGNCECYNVNKLHVFRKEPMSNIRLRLRCWWLFLRETEYHLWLFVRQTIYAYGYVI